MNKCALILLIIIQILFCINVSATIRPNRLYNPSFVKMIQHKDSLMDWMKMTYIEASSDTVRINNSLFVGTVFDELPAHAESFSLHHNFIIPNTAKRLQLKLTAMFGYPDQTTSPIMLCVRKFVKGIPVETDSVVLSKTEKLNTWDLDFLLPKKCTDFDIHIQSKGTASYVLDSMAIKIDGVNIENVEIQNDEKKPRRIKEIVKNTTSEYQFNNSPMILGLGESIHGSETLNSVRNHIIFEAIKQNQMDVLLMELPAYLVDKMNRYINGVIDTLNMSIAYNLELEELLQGIRKLNANRKKSPIQMVGFDIAQKMDYINSLRYCLRQYRDAAKTSSNELITMTEKSIFDSTLTKLCPINENVTTMSDSTFWGNYQIKQLENPELFFWGSKNSTLRDSTMFENTKMIVEHFGSDKKYIIYAHLTHLMKTKMYSMQDYTPSLGYYLNQTYGKNYKVLGLFAEKGETCCKINHKDSISSFFGVHKLAEPIENSVEMFCSKLNLDSFYLTNWKNKSWMKDVCRSRFSGNYVSDIEFEPINLDEIDALFFTKHSEALNSKPFIIYKHIL